MSEEFSCIASTATSGYPKAMPSFPRAKESDSKLTNTLARLLSQRSVKNMLVMKIECSIRKMLLQDP